MTLTDLPNIGPVLAEQKAELKRWFNDVTRGIKTGV